MATIAENLQTLVEQKAAIKAALDNKGKEPTDALKTYAGLIDELENDDQNTYVITNAAGTHRAYAIKSSETPVTLTATSNDIRLGTTAVTNEGYTEGGKDIPAYHSETGRKIVLAGENVSITKDTYDYTKIQVIVTDYNTNIDDSVATSYVVIGDSVYKSGATEKVADVTKDDTTQSINLGITADKKSVLRYFIMREER